MNVINLVNKELAERQHQARAFGVAVDDLVIVVQVQQTALFARLCQCHRAPHQVLMTS